MVKVSKVIVSDNGVGFEISFIEYNKFLKWRDEQIKKCERATKRAFKKLREEKVSPVIESMKIDIALSSLKIKYPINFTSWLKTQGVL